MASGGTAGEDVYCTLVLSDAYLPGAAVLAHSLRDAGVKHKLACLITQDTLRDSTVTELRSLYNYVVPIDRIGNPNPANLYLMGRPDLLYTFTKVHLWRMTQFRKVVYIDADVVALRSVDELFDVQEEFAAASDVGWPDIFNTGVMALTPNTGDYNALRALASAGDSFDGADQGLLNQYFEHRPWRRLSFTYNVTPSGSYQYEPAYRYFKRDIKLVHFIGSEKPWQKDRQSSLGGSGAFQELVGRWWAVYDRHFKVSTYEYSATGRREPLSSGAIQQQVKAEQQPNYAAMGYPAESTQPAPPPEVPMAEDPVPQAEAIDQGLMEPTPTQQQRKFSAPHMEWDATRAAPPSDSKPEVSSFPQTTYEFNTDPKPFQPPAQYPEPPRGMWYQVPTEKPKPLPAIFPWEERQHSRPTRVFIEDQAPPPPPEPESKDEDEDDFSGGDELAGEADEPVEPKTPTVQVTETPWESFGKVNRNAWDEVEGIEDYVRALTSWQRNRGKVQVLSPSNDESRTPTGAGQIPQGEHILSPSNEPDPVELVEKVRQRRESLILTDFPSAVERPSLPVTPAPRRRPTFWGEERDDQGELPPAEGVPEQADWNPDDQLEELRRNSLLSPADLKLPDKQKIPRREMPGSSAPIPSYDGTSDASKSSAASAKGMLGSEAMALAAGKTSLTGAATGTAIGADVAEKNAVKVAPTFSEPVFDAPSSSGAAAKAEASVLSPTEQTEEELAP